VIQRCRSCSQWIHYPRVVCPSCLSGDLAFEPVAGTGTVYSYTWAHRAAGRAFADAVPYLVAIVELDEGVRLMTTMADASHDDVAVGKAVTLAGFEETAEGGPPVPIFRLR
jgi:uncharacterized OB-fold protein